MTLTLQKVAQSFFVKQAHKTAPEQINNVQKHIIKDSLFNFMGTRGGAIDVSVSVYLLSAVQLFQDPWNVELQDKKPQDHD